MYVILKQVEMQVPGTENKIIVPVILLDSNDEILEFDDKEKAENVKMLFEKNSTHSSIYEVKEV